MHSIWKRSRELTFTLLTTLLIVGCQPKECRPKGEMLHLNISEDAASLDPRVVRRVKDLTLVRQLFEGLTRVDEHNTPQLALAESYDLSDDLLTYTFHLRPSQWSDGSAVTASDFEQAWKKALDPAFRSDYAYMLYPIKNAHAAHTKACSLDAVGVHAIDARTLKVELEKPTPYFLELTAFPTFFPVNSALDQSSTTWTNPPGDRFVSNGPFSLEKWTPDQEIVLKKNPAYWDAEHVHLDGISFSIIADNNTESLLFDRGELDWLGQPFSNNIATELLGKLKEKNRLESYLIAGTFWFTYNVEKPPFTNANIRKAFALALSRQEIIEHILQGNQSAATSPIPPSMALHPTPYFEDGATQEAVALFEKGLAQEGWTRETLPPIYLKYPAKERTSKIVQCAQQKWQETFQIPIELIAKEYQLYRAEQRKGEVQLGTGEWIADYHDPISFLELFKYRNDSETGSGMNPTNWENSHYVSLLDASERERNPTKRQKLLHEAEELLMAQMPIIPLYHYAFDYVKKENIDGVVLSPLGSSDFKTASIR